MSTRIFLTSPTNGRRKWLALQFRTIIVQSLKHNTTSIIYPLYVWFGMWLDFLTLQYIYITYIKMGEHLESLCIRIASPVKQSAVIMLIYFTIYINICNNFFTFWKCLWFPRHLTIQNEADLIKNCNKCSTFSRDDKKTHAAVILTCTIIQSWYKWDFYTEMWRCFS